MGKHSKRGKAQETEQSQQKSINFERRVNTNGENFETIIYGNDTLGTNPYSVIIKENKHVTLECNAQGVGFVLHQRGCV